MRERRQGFTMIELLVVVALLAIVLTGATNLMLSTLRGSSKSQALTEVQQQGNFALEKLERQLRYARVIKCDESTDAGSIVFEAQDADEAWQRYCYMRNASSNTLLEHENHNVDDSKPLCPDPKAGNFYPVTNNEVKMTVFQVDCDLGDEFTAGRVALRMHLESARDPSVSQVFRTSVLLRNPQQ